MKKILSLGDVHGRDKWMFHTHGSPYEFEWWKVAVENGAPGDDDYWKDHPYMEYDKIIFVGDYADSYDLKNEVILNNLKNIVFFKKMVPNRVELLIGNHDIQYFIENEICSGYRTEMKADLCDIYNDKKAGFKLAHYEVGDDGQQWLWTHAGVTNGWLKELRREVYNPNHRFYDIVKDLDFCDLLNTVFEMRLGVVFNVDAHSGGIDLWAGPLWVRPSVFNDYPLEGINQVVGHTPQRGIKVDWCKGVNHHFIDCLWDDYDEALKIKI